MDDLLDEARASLGAVVRGLEAVGGHGVALGDAPMAVGASIRFNEDRYVVLSVMGGAEATVQIAAGVAKDVPRQIELELLQLCNRFTKDNPAYPAFLHDAPIGWDIITQTAFPVRLAMEVPGYIASVAQHLPIVADEVAGQVLRSGGSAYADNRDDLQRLLIRSTL
jgi:hypothetical protein